MRLSDNEEAEYIGEARRLLASALDAPDLASQIDEKTSFLDGGINSGELVLLLLRVEDHLGIEIDDDELSGITSLNALAAFLHRHAEGKDHVV